MVFKQGMAKWITASKVKDLFHSVSKTQSTPGQSDLPQGNSQTQSPPLPANDVADEQQAVPQFGQGPGRFSCPVCNAITQRPEHAQETRGLCSKCGQTLLFPASSSKRPRLLKLASIVACAIVVLGGVIFLLTRGDGPKIPGIRSKALEVTARKINDAYDANANCG